MPTSLHRAAVVALLLLAAGCAGPAGSRSSAPSGGAAERAASGAPGAGGTTTGKASSGGAGGAATDPEAAAEAPAAPARPGCSAAMVSIPAGRMPLAGKQVQVAEYCLDATEVTMAAWRRCVAAGACPQASTTGEWPGMAADQRAASGRLCNEGRAGRELHPVNCVSAAEAARFCAWRGARLPTEVEHAWAARGGPRGWRYPWGDAPPVDQACWAREPGRQGEGAGMTCPVSSHPLGRSPQGASDLSGNVAEWTQGPAGGPVARGGSFVDVLADSLTAEARWFPAPERSGAIGFRCAAAPR